MSERFVKTQSGIITNKLLAGDTGNSIVGLLQIYLCSVDSRYRYLHAHLNTGGKLYLHISNEHSSLIKAVLCVVSIIDMITSQWPGCDGVVPAATHVAKDMGMSRSSGPHGTCCTPALAMQCTPAGTNAAHNTFIIAYNFIYVVKVHWSYIWPLLLNILIYRYIQHYSQYSDSWTEGTYCISNIPVSTPLIYASYERICYLHVSVLGVLLFIASIKP